MIPGRKPTKLDVATRIMLAHKKMPIDEVMLEMEKQGTPATRQYLQCIRWKIKKKFPQLPALRRPPSAEYQLATKIMLAHQDMPLNGVMAEMKKKEFVLSENDLIRMRNNIRSKFPQLPTWKEAQRLQETVKSAKGRLMGYKGNTGDSGISARKVLFQRAGKKEMQLFRKLGWLEAMKSLLGKIVEEIAEQKKVSKKQAIRIALENRIKPTMVFELEKKGVMHVYCLQLDPQQGYFFNKRETTDTRSFSRKSRAERLLKPSRKISLLGQEPNNAGQKSKRQ